MQKAILWIDGAARGNPGPAAIGILVTDEDGHELESVGEAIGVATNNEAEYRALLRGLGLAAKHHAEEVQVQTDSRLLAQQINREFKVKASRIKWLFAEAQGAMAPFSRVNVQQIPRELNRRADALANRALDEEAKSAK
jgi:ribonuclease HI